MAKDTFWFKHDYNSRSDRKMLKLRMKHGMQGIGIYWCIVEMLYEDGGYVLRLDYERISFELQTNIECITSVLNDFDLFESNDDNFWSNSVLNRLNIRHKKSEKNRMAINERWQREKDKRNTNVLHTNYEPNTIIEKSINSNIVKQITNPKMEKNGTDTGDQQVNIANPSSESTWLKRFNAQIPKGKQSGTENC